jgi:hypothetical protein
MLMLLMLLPLYELGKAKKKVPVMVVSLRYLLSISIDTFFNFVNWFVNVNTKKLMLKLVVDI